MKPIYAMSMGLAAAILLHLPASVPVANAMEEPGYVVVATPASFVDLEKRVAAAVAKNQMNIVTRASASDGAKGRGIVIRGDAVLGIFRNDFAVRMLAANVDAGIEAPVRLHLVEEPDGTSSIRYRKPGVLFGHYDGEAIKQVGRELDVIFDAIIADAIAK